jgi:hypothetical protein
MKVLTSRYDIYQDTMNPSNFPFLAGIHPDWTTAAGRLTLIRQANGDWRHGWGVKGTNGIMYDCGVLCDSRALDYARARIPAELATRPYLCRFIDTTTASPWNECYDPHHPMTRTESREWKMKLLDYVSHDCKLVTGSETGHDAAVPFVDYFEGMLSLGPYRVPDAGRDMQRIWDDPPERVAKFQLGQAYRLPLWELVYHDCVVASGIGATTTTNCRRCGTSATCSTCFTARRRCSCLTESCGKPRRPGSCKVTPTPVPMFAPRVTPK